MVVNCAQLVLISVCHVTCITALQGCFTVNSCKNRSCTYVFTNERPSHFSSLTFALVRQGMVGRSVKKVKRAKLANRKSQGVLPSKRLLGMCRWMGSHFHNWIDYNGVTFLVELLEWGRTFSRFLG